MARPEGSHVRSGVLVCAFVSIALAACSSSSGTPNVVDSGVDGKAMLATDAGDAKTPDVKPDLLPDQALEKPTADTHAEAAADTGGAAGTSGAGGTAGAGGAPGAGGAAGVGGVTGTGGAALGGAPGTGGTTSSTGGTTGAGGADAGVDAPSDTPATTDAPAEGGVGGIGGTDSGDGSDTTPACGAGCPPTIQGSHLALWLAADFGVSCDQGRVTGWQDRGSLNQTIAPVSGKSGPKCGVDTIAGRPALFFDSPGTDDTDGVLTVNLNAILKETDYTVLVVERRQTDAEGYILGTTGMSTNCDEIADTAYHFGYDTQYLPTPKFAVGPYSVDGNTNCIDPISSYATYSPSAPAAIDVEVFDQTIGHKLAINGTVADSNNDMNTISGLAAGYIGRAFNVLSLGTRHSRYLGDVAEIVIYNVALSDTDRTAVEGYLKQRWNP